MIHLYFLYAAWLYIYEVFLFFSSVDWWVFLVAGLDAFLVMFIVTICTCCLCPNCPFYFQPIKMERKIKPLPLPPISLPPKLQRSSSIGVWRHQWEITTFKCVCSTVLVKWRSWDKSDIALTQKWEHWKSHRVTSWHGYGQRWTA